MSKTAREVIENISGNAFQILSRDDKPGLAQLIEQKLNAAGFVIVPKDRILSDEDIATIQAAVENLRSADKTEQRTIDAAWRIASRLEQIAKRAADSPPPKED